MKLPHNMQGPSCVGLEPDDYSVPVTDARRLRFFLMDQQQLESENLLPEWAFVEVMGHSKICGRLTPVKMGVAMMLRVDVLKADAGPVLVPAPEVFAYSKMFSPASLFSITPVDYKYCLAWAKERERYDAAPVPYIQNERPEPQRPRLENYPNDDDDQRD